MAFSLYDKGATMKFGRLLAFGVVSFVLTVGSGAMTGDKKNPAATPINRDVQRHKQHECRRPSQPWIGHGAAGTGHENGNRQPEQQNRFHGISSVG